VTLTLIGLAGLAYYAADCWIHPFGPCRRCKGNPRKDGWINKKFYGRCKKCGGTGERTKTRIGHRILRHLLGK
jgi:hypothetical protein